MTKKFILIILSFLLTSNILVNIKEKSINEENNTILIQCLYPYLETEKKIESVDKINKEIEQHLNMWISDLKDLAEKTKSQYKESKTEYRTFELNTVYKVTLNKENIISLYMDYYQYTGGAHGLTTRISYNFDLKTGNKIKLNNIFKEGYDYKAVIDKEINRQIDEHPEYYFSDKNAFKGIKTNQEFYLTDKGIVIYFQQYEIAPYSSGIREFRIPFSLFKDGI